MKRENVQDGDVDNLSQFRSKIRRQLSLTSSDLREHQANQDDYEKATDGLFDLAKGHMSEADANEFAEWQSRVYAYHLPERLRHYEANPERMAVDLAEERRLNEVLRTEKKNIAGFSRKRRSPSK